MSQITRLVRFVIRFYFLLLIYLSSWLYKDIFIDVEVNWIEPPRAKAQSSD